MNRDFKQMAPLERQADMLASKGRFGDTMLVHMNPTEVDVLRQMTPGGQLTINPDTGQPEAFLPLLLGLGGALAGGASLLGPLSALTAGAIGTGLGTTIETGSLKEGLRAGLISGLIGNVAGKFFDTSGAVAGAGGKVGEGVVEQAVSDVAQQGMVNPFGGAPVARTVSSAAPQVAASGPFFPGLPAVSQTAAPQVVQEAAKESPSLITNLLTDPNVKQSALQGGITGITGQALTDQYNLLNPSMGPGLDEDEEEFYVPVTPRDRGVQFPGSGFSGSGEFDFFRNPFGFDPTPPVGFQEGGMVQGATKAFQEGGQVEEPAPRRSDYGGSIRQQQAYNDAVAEYERNYGPLTANTGFPSVDSYRPSPDIPDYFKGPSSVGTNLEDMITEQVTERIYTPREEQMPSLSVSNIRGADAVDFVDYNRRLLGDPTRTRDITRPMTEEEISARDQQLAVMQAEEAANAPASVQPAVQFDPLQFMRSISGRSGEMYMPEFGGDFNSFTPSIGTGAAPTSFDPTMPAMDFAAPVNTGFTPVSPVGLDFSSQFDPLAGMNFGQGQGGFNFGIGM